MHFDVIIIGSGPAASTAAITCTRHNLNVLIITDKEQYRKGSKETEASESIHPGVRSALDQLNAVGIINSSVQGIYKGIEINGKLNLLGNAEKEWEGYHLNRIQFDQAFLQSAKEQGATVRYKDRVVRILSNEHRITGVKTGSGITITSSYVIDASGHQRIGGRQLRIKENFASLPLITWTGVTIISDDALNVRKDFTHFIPHTDGWTWLAPEYNHRCTWTRLAIKSHLEFLPPPALQIYPLMSAIKVYNRRWRVFRPVCKEGILLCGDAAGILDPAAGQGILNAIVSANMAANTVKACIADPSFEAFHLARYDDWFINNYQDKLGRLKKLYTTHGINIFSKEKM